jgi:hypothetical protein
VRFRVYVPELWIQEIIVEAGSPAEARELAAQGVGEDGDFEPKGVLTGEPWKVEEVITDE